MKHYKILRILNYLREIILIISGIAMLVCNISFTNTPLYFSLSLGIIFTLLVSFLNKFYSYQDEKTLFPKSVFTIVLITVFCKITLLFIL